MEDKLKRLMGIGDARSMRGILSRGKNRYGVANAPKPGNIFNVQRAAKNRLKKYKRLDQRRYR